MKPDTIRVIEWPLVEPVTLSEAKAQCGLLPDQTEHDRFLLDKIGAARRLVESRLSVSLVATRYRATWRSGAAVLHLPAPPGLIDEGHPLTITVDGDAVSSEAYDVDQDAFPAAVTFTTAQTGKVVATYWAGVAPGQPIDPMARSAILAYVNHQFENRGVMNTEGGGELPQAFETLLAACSWNGGW